MKYEPDEQFGIPIGLPPEMMPDIPRITSKEDGEAIYFAMAKAAKRERRR